MSESYTIYPQDYAVGDKRLLAWIEANNLDPQLIPYDSPLQVEDGILTAITYKRAEQGRKLHNLDGNPVTETVQVPLLSHPGEHHLPLVDPSRRFVDLRFHFTGAQDERGGHLELSKVTRQAVSHVPMDVLHGMGWHDEALAKAEAFVAKSVLQVLSNGKEASA